MKKLFSMMLMLCAIVTFTACSSENDEPQDTCPVSDVVVPTSAKIGSEVTVQGKGFTSSQKFYLSYPEFGAYPVELTDAKVSASGVTFTVPYTATEGKTVSFTVSTDEKDWKFGSMTILAADSPVSAVSIPSQMPLLADAFIITGTGFAEGDVIGICEEEGKEVDYLDTKVVDGGVSVNTLTALEGNVNVYLRRGNSEWKIGQTYSYFPRVISSITISDNAFLSIYAGSLGLDGNELKLEMTYDADYALQKVTSNSVLEWDLTYSGNTVSFTGQFTGMPYTYTLDENKRIVSSTSYGIYGDEVTYTWNYDTDGYLVSITSSEDETILESTYADGNLQAYTFGVDCGTDNQNVYSAFPATVEPVYLLNSFSWITTKEELFFGFLLNQNVKISRSILSQFNAVDSEYGQLDEEKVKSFDVTTELGENTMTIETKSEDGIMSMDGGLYSNKVAVAYEIKKQKDE